MKLMVTVQDALRVKEYAYHTERTYLWTVFISVLNTPSSYKPGIKHTMLVESRVRRTSRT